MSQLSVDLKDDGPVAPDEDDEEPLELNQETTRDDREPSLGDAKPILVNDDATEYREETFNSEGPISNEEDAINNDDEMVIDDERPDYDEVDDSAEAFNNQKLIFENEDVDDRDEDQVEDIDRTDPPSSGIHQRQHLLDGDQPEAKPYPVLVALSIACDDDDFDRLRLDGYQLIDSSPGVQTVNDIPPAPRIMLKWESYDEAARGVEDVAWIEVPADADPLEEASPGFELLRTVDFSTCPEVRTFRTP